VRDLRLGHKELLCHPFPNQPELRVGIIFCGVCALERLLVSVRLDFPLSDCGARLCELKREIGTIGAKAVS
jgi:hypothetical protein